MVAVGCHILKEKCTKFDSGWGFAPDPATGAYSAPQDLPAGVKGVYEGGEGQAKGKRRKVVKKWEIQREGWT